MENNGLDLVILWDVDMYRNQATTSGVSSENKGMALVTIWEKEMYQNLQVASGAGPPMEYKGMVLVVMAKININRILSIAKWVDPSTNAKDVALVMQRMLIPLTAREVGHPTGGKVVALDMWEMYNHHTAKGAKFSTYSVDAPLVI